MIDGYKNNMYELTPEEKNGIQEWINLNNDRIIQQGRESTDQKEEYPNVITYNE
jgi:hypothetical protein